MFTLKLLFYLYFISYKNLLRNNILYITTNAPTACKMFKISQKHEFGSSTVYKVDKNFFSKYLSLAYRIYVVYFSNHI